MENSELESAMSIPPLSTTCLTASRVYDVLSRSVGNNATIELRNADGSTRPTTNADLAAMDLKTKLKAAAESIQGLTSEQKIIWAEGQRKAGNLLFKKGKYREAIDIYLTCLVGAEHTVSENCVGQVNSPQNSKFEEEVILPVLLNLAACTQQLGQHNKTIKFCTEALSLPSNCGRKRAKLWYRRGKAYMAIGEYRLARSDLDEANARSQILESGYEGDIELIRRGLEKLTELEEAGRKNYEKKKKAMKFAFGGGAVVGVSGKKKVLSKGLYDDVKKRRAHSTLTDRTTVREKEVMDDKVQRPVVEVENGFVGATILFFSTLFTLLRDYFWTAKG